MTTEVDLEAAIEELERARADVEAAAVGLGEYDRGEVARLEEAYTKALSILDSYEERATEGGDFQGYVEFRQEFEQFVNDLDRDLPEREAFETAEELLDQRRLSTADFDEARDALKPVAGLVEALADLRSASDDASEARRGLLDVREQLAERRAHLEDLRDVDPAILEVDIAALREPVATYNEAVRSAHQSFLSERPVRSVLTVYEHMSYFSLVDVTAPPDALQSFFADHPTGSKPIPRIRELLSYSRSKLGHYVDDPGHFLGEVQPHSGYLEGLSAEPFTIAWVPPEHEVFTWQLDELERAVNRFAGEETVAALRALEALCRDEQRYRRLRTAAVYGSRLDETDRELLATGGIEAELADIESNIDRIDAVLED